jgi:hypothetical protein
MVPSLQPIVALPGSGGIGPLPALLFDGTQTALLGNVSIQGAKTVLAAIRATSEADACCSTVVLTHAADVSGCSSNGAMGGCTNGIALKKAGSDVVAVLDFAGENNGGEFPVTMRAAVVAATFGASDGAAANTLHTDGCLDIADGRQLAHVASQFAIGARASDPEHEHGRYFKGAIGEVLLYNRALSNAERLAAEVYLAARWGTPNPANNSMCSGSGVLDPVVMGTFSIPASAPAAPTATSATSAENGTAAATTPSLELTFAAVSSLSAPTPTSTSTLAQTPAPAPPIAVFEAATARVKRLATKVRVSTPDPQLNVGIPAAAASVDGLFRSEPSVFLHGAMAWDVALVGWRSEYGATVWGWEEEVAAEGVYMFGNQVKETGANTVCVTDPARLMTQEAHNSRFYGKGRVKGGDGMFVRITRLTL